MRAFYAWRMVEKVRKSRRGLYRLLTTVLIVGLWFGGALGLALRPVLLHLLPKVNRQVTITYQGTGDLPDPPVRATLTVSETRLLKLAHDLLGWRAWLIPPKLIPPTYTIAGVARLALDEEAQTFSLPFIVRITPAVTAPALDVRLPSDLVNQALDYEGSFTSREKRHKYVLGHYDTTLWVDFDTVSLTSILTEHDLRRPVTFRRISGEATGRVRLRVKENIGRARVTARVRRMELRCDFDFKQYLDGLSIAYKLTIPKLDADINNLAPMFEGRPTEALRKRLEESMGRPRRLERMARKRYPLGLPLDLALTLEVFKSEKEPEQ